MTDYILDKKFNEAESRLNIQERLLDPSTIEYLIKIGVQEGWHCLELGAGRGSITSWLCRRVGSKGRVTAVDLDTKFLKLLSFDNLEIVEKDIAQYDLGYEKYDLIHTRDFLVHINHRETVIRKMAGALKYRGWILLEEPDVITDTPDPLSPQNKTELYRKVTDAIYQFLQKSGLDPYVGRKLLGFLNSFGFDSLQAEGRVRMFIGAPGQIKSPHMMAFEQLKDAIVAEGYVTESEFKRFLNLANDSSFAWREGLTMSVWGQRPEDPHSTGSK